MKQLLFILFTPVLFTHAQKPEKPSRQPVSVGFVFSTDYNFRTLVENGPGVVPVIESRNETEKGKVSFTTGGALLFQLSKIAGFETGVLFSVKGYQTKSIDLSFLQPDPNAPITAVLTYQFFYLDIPLKFNFNFGNKVMFLAGAGSVLNFQLDEKQKSKHEYQDGRQEKTKSASNNSNKKFNLSTSINIGVGYKPVSHLLIKAEPTFRYGLMKISDYPVSEKLWNLGLNLGLYYQL